jgi:hypothetical protein
MARNESDREDLLAEATALSPRAEWLRRDEVVHVGVRRDGAVSIYFDGDPMYQFDAEGRLRRGLVGGRLYRTQGTTLARLTRVRTETETQLQRHELSLDETNLFLAEMQRRLRDFLADIEAGLAVVGRTIPDRSSSGELISALVRAMDHPGLAPRLPTRP